VRFGLCCLFRDQPIKFRTTTATAVLKLPREEALAKISLLCLENTRALRAALEYCARHGIGDFRINSQILPLKTHPLAGYSNDELPDWLAIRAGFQDCAVFAREASLRTSFHPDQFIVLSSPREEVILSSLAEIEYQAEIAELIGSDVINIHGGGAYGDKQSALMAFHRSFARLSPRARALLTVENDDRVYTPADLLPLCRDLGIPLVYDVHHQRCNSDGLGIAEATSAAFATWNREPLFHISSPINGWAGPNPERHHDFIDPADFPSEWEGLDITVEVEAKAKEAAVRQLIRDLAARGNYAVTCGLEEPS
jgi:UV DNA damage endonuclease